MERNERGTMEECHGADAIRTHTNQKITSKVRDT